MAPYRLLIILCFFTSAVSAQTNRYMVFFEDKAGTPHVVSQPETFLSDRAITRRAKALKQVDQDDLPVTPGYVTQVRGTGAKAFFTSRWMNGVLVEATPAMLASINLLPFVKSTEFVAPNAQLIGGRKGTKGLTTSIAASEEQLHQLGIDSMHADGYRGEGVMVAILDSGFPGVESTAPFLAVRSGNQIKMEVDFITNSGNVYQFNDHGTKVFSIIAAETSTFQGAAPKADFLLFVTEDVGSEYRIEEYNWLFAAERADSAGADIIQTSVGYTDFDDPSMDHVIADLDGETAVISRAAGFARDRGVVVVASAGNLGNTAWRFISPPADADGIITVGAIQSDGTKASFSSVGPTADGRIKPDVVAPGVGVSVISASGSVAFANGTSVAAPLVTSLAAGLVQAFPNVVPSALVNMIRQSATNASTSNNDIGYGVPSYQAVRNFINRSPFAVYAYPNPVANTLWFSINPAPDEMVSLTIYNMQGKEMVSTSLFMSWSNNPVAIDVAGLASGLYIVRTVTSAGIHSERFIKL
ncbi:MAG: S8 family peptidase [Cyclobacteriaceae bacterium]|nr:S8 family peptidase [Cyclobacteriaceae bacterium]